jgi:hypothetical protein
MQSKITNDKLRNVFSLYSTVLISLIFKVLLIIEKKMIMCAIQNLVIELKTIEKKLG